MGDAAGRLVLLATSPRVAPGLLTWEAWSLVRAADVVLLPDDDHPLREPLESAGARVELVAAHPVEDLAAHLLAAARGREAVWVASADGDPGLAAALLADLPETDGAPASAGPLLDGAPAAAPVGALGGDGVPGVDVVLVDGEPAAAPVGAPGGDGVPGVDVVLGSWDLPGAHLLDLVAVMDRLRSPGGCPWDAEQTHESLVEYLVEEAYETVEAIETGDDAALREELGDLLLQVAFHARIAQEQDEPWGIDDVADGIAAKLVSRHPHVFAVGVQAHDAARTPDEVEASWKRLKAAEKGRASVTDGIPASLPALVLAGKLLRRASDVDVAPVAPDAVAAAASALEPLVAARADRGTAYGDLLLALAASARADGVDAEQALRDALRTYRTRIRHAEHLPD